MPEPHRLVLVSLVAAYLTIIVHEVGHALAGRAMGFEVTSLGVGAGRPFLVLPVGRARFYFGRVQPFMGITFAFLPRLDFGRRRLAVYVAGGILANLLCALVAVGLACGLWPSRLAAFFATFAAINVVMGVSNLVPLEFKVGGGSLRSDGKILLDAIRSGSMAPTPASIIQTATACRPLWRAIGDRRIDRAYTLLAASSWTDLGAIDRADVLLGEAEAIGEPHPYLDWLQALFQANLALSSGEVAEAKVALERLERLTDPGSPESRVMLDLLRAHLWRLEGELAPALQAFERLEADPLIGRNPSLGASLLAGHLSTACVAGDAGAIAELRLRHRRRRPPPSDVNNLHFYGTLARHTAAPEDYRLALNAVAAIAASWLDPADQAAFLRAQQGLLDDARRVLGDDSVAFAGAAPAPPESYLLRRDKTLLRWARWLMLLNVVAFAASVGLALTMDKQRSLPAFFLAAMIGLFTIMSVVYLAVDFAIGRLRPALKRSTGFILLALTALPWAGVMIFGLVALFNL